MKVIIVGCGQVGAYLAGLLLERGHEVRVIEMKEARVAILKKQLPADQILVGNGTDPKLLQQAGVQHADVVAAVTGLDETNLVVATLAKLEYGVPRVVGRVNNPKNAWLFTPVMGIDAALNQADVMARLVAEEMSMGDMMTLLKLHGGKYSLVERVVGASSSMTGKALRDIRFPAESMLVAVIRNADLLVPRGNTVLLSNDKVILITHIDRLEILDSMFEHNEET